MQLKGAAAQRFSRSPDPAIRAMLYFGPNRSRVEEAGAELARTLLGPEADQLGLTRLTEDEVRKDKARLADEMAAQSLLGGARVIRLRADGESAADAIVAVVADLNAGRPAAAFLIVEGGDFKARSKIRDAFEKSDVCACVAFYEESGDELATYAASLVRDAPFTIEPAARDAFLATLPGDRAGIRAEVEKLSLYAHRLDRALDEADIRALSIAAGESEIDEAAGAVLNGKADIAARALERAEVSNGVTIIKALERKLLRLMEAHTLMAEGVPANDVAGKVKPPVFWKEKDAFGAQLRVWTPQRLQGALARLWSAEVACKSAGAPSVLIASQTFVEIARLISSARR